MGKAKRTLVRTMAAMLSVTALLGGTACGGMGGGSNKGDTTVITVANFGGGIGRKWLDEAAERFSEIKKDTEYESGKKGVSFDVTNAIGITCVNMKTSGTNIFFLQDRYSECFGEIQKGSVLDITDIVKDQTLAEYGEDVTIESKIDEEYRFALKGNDGKYYMLPHYETQSGASYDVDMFENMGFYLAQKDDKASKHTSTLTGQTHYFTNKNYKTKTVGNDGEAGTDDDGMPTTLNELVAMCEYIKKNNVWPFSVAGSHLDYTNYLIEGLWTALAGYEQRSAVVSHKGTVEYVKGISKTELWPGTGIYKPVTETAENITSETGYKAINQASRYYAFAFIELAYKKGWFYESYQKSDYNHKEAMRAFILNGLSGKPKIASHVEGSYWYNEAESYNLFNDYKVFSGKDTMIKNIKHWHMPTSYGNDVVTGKENAREEAVINGMTSTAMINGNLDDYPGSEGIIKACKDFLKFLSTEQELKNFTASTGVAKALYSYTIDESVLQNLDPYQQSVMRLRANNPVVNQYGDNATYRAKSGAMTYSISADGYRPTFDGVQYTSPIHAYWKKGKNAYECFTQTGFTETKWKSEIYAG